MGFIEREKKTYASIISDGTMRVACDKNDPLAVEREWETSDGKSGVKYERVYHGYKGFIKDIQFNDGMYGKTITIVFAKDDENSDDLHLQLAVASNFAEDFMKKLPNIDLTKEVSISPFSFKNDNDKTVRGMTVWQAEDPTSGKFKLPSFFHDYNEDTKKTTFKNGYPEIPAGELDKDDWKMYFMQCRKFLVKYIEENIIPKFATLTPTQVMEAVGGKEVTEEQTTTAPSQPASVDPKEAAEAELSVDEIPFD